MQKINDDKGRKKLNKFDVYMMLVSGILFADIIASNTWIPSITWWVMLGLIYNNLNIVTGTIDLFIKTFGSTVFYYLIGLPFVFCIFSQCLTWIIGGARGIAESAKEGEFPSVLGIETKAGLF